MQFDDCTAFSECYKVVDELIDQNPELTLESIGSNVQAFFIRKAHRQ